MRILLWHVHVLWTTSFVQGGHEYVLPVLPDRLADLDLDAVVLQPPHEVELVEGWVGRRPGRDLPAG